MRDGVIVRNSSRRTPKSHIRIPLWSGLCTGQGDIRTHYWYQAQEDQWRRVCDDELWSGTVQAPNPTRPFIPCRNCQGLYTQDLAFGPRVFEFSASPPMNADILPSDNVVYSPLLGGDTRIKRGSIPMEQPAIGMATFARFYDATSAEKVSIIRDTRMFVADRESYVLRDYYAGLRNTLRQTHWATGDLSTFEDALSDLLAQQRILPKKEHYEKLGQAYIKYWQRQNAIYFEVEDTTIEIAGLPILITPEFGMRHHGDNLAVKLWLGAPQPKRTFRQAIQYLMDEAQRRGWRTDLQPVLFDVRREVILPRVSLPKDFPSAMAGQAAAFRYMWDSI